MKDLTEILKAHAELRKAARPAGIEDDGSASTACYPKWRILSDAAVAGLRLQTWWEEHGHACQRCRARVEQVRKDNRDHQAVQAVLEEILATGPVQPLRFLSLSSTQQGLRWAAATADDPTSPRSPIPVVSFHHMTSVSDQNLDSVWLVTWNHRVFLLLCGRPDALERWKSGVVVGEKDGQEETRFVAADENLLDLLCPNGMFQGHPVLCFGATRSIGDLGPRDLSIPGLLTGSVQLRPHEEAEGHGEGLVFDLTTRNRVGRFLEGLPEGPQDEEEAVTYGFYIRFLARQRRIAGPHAKRVCLLSWIPDDVRTLLSGAD